MKATVFFAGLLWAGMMSGVHAEEQPIQESEVVASGFTLSQAVELAMQNNVRLGSAEMDLQASREVVAGESFYMEPDLVLKASTEEGARQNTIEQSVSLLSDTYEWENTRYSAAIEGLLPLGTTYRLGYEYSDLANNLTSRTFREPFVNQYRSRAELRLTQPLLKNFGLTVTRKDLLHARLREDVAAQKLRKQKMLTVANVALAYGDVWMQQELVRVRQSSLSNARELLDDNKKRHSAGKMASREVEAARVGVVDRETQWLYANTQWRAALNELANLLSVGIESDQIELELEDQGMMTASELSAEAQLEGLSTRHPDILIRQREVDSSELQMKIMKNQRLPELNLEGVYGRSGLGETGGDSYSDIEGGEFDDWSVSLVLRVGLAGGQKGKHQLLKAKVDLERSLMEYSYAEKELGNRLRTSLRNASLLEDAVRQGEDAVEINTRALDAEKQLLKAGKSKTARLLEVEEDLLMAQEDLLRGRVRQLRSLVELQLANGRILEAYGME